MKRDLRDLPVPEHRDGFWDDLVSRLDGEVQELPLEASTRNRPAGWMLAPAAAAIVVVAVAGVSGLLGGTEKPGPGEIATPSTEETTTTAAAETATTTFDQGAPDAPWTIPVPADTVPPELAAAWSAAENRTWCSALAISDPVLTDGYTARDAEFGGGWGLAYDAPDLRSAFGVAGAGLVAEAEMATRWPTVRHYRDGSVVGYGGEGFDQDNPRRLGELVVAGQGCIYQVWSELGDQHLASVIDSLRFVEGLQAAPVVLVTEVEVRDGGTAPWVANPPTSAPPFDLSGRRDAGLGGPLLVPTTVEFDDAVTRPAAVGAWAVAWDAPGQPGHDSFNQPCETCGRGAVGFAEFVPSEAPTGPSDRPLRIEYEDGAHVEIGYYVGDDRLPPDRAQFAASDTGEPVIGGYQASVFVADGRQYLLWSHLGLDHLLGLVDGLREAALSG